MHEPMSDFITNSYHLALQDNRGQWFLTVDAESFTDAMDQGATLRDEGSCKDFAIYRVLFNSATTLHENYNVKTSQ